MTDQDEIDDEALTWLIRTEDPDFDQWDAFTLWLEGNPANAAAYHRFAGAQRDLLPAVAKARLPEAIARPLKARGVSRRWAVAAAGASIIAASSALLIQRSAPVSYATLPGEMRTIALGGQDRIVMNGATRIEVSGLNRRSVRLAQGQILLSLRESDAGPIEVKSGDLTLVDVGTVFEVARDGQSTRVSVAEGEVVADPNGAALHLPRGTSLVAKDGQAVLKSTKTEARSVGAWTGGQLVYSNAALSEVVSDLRRSAGMQIQLAPAAGSLSFTGTLSIAEVRADPRSLEPLLGVQMRRSGPGWVILGGAP